MVVKHEEHLHIMQNESPVDSINAIFFNISNMHIMNLITDRTKIDYSTQII